MENQYPFLRLAVTLMKTLSYVALALGVVGAIFILFGKTPGSGKLASLGVLVMGGVWGLVFYLASEVIRLLLAMDVRMKTLEANQQASKKEIR